MNSIEVGSQSSHNLTTTVGIPEVSHRSQPWYEAYMAALFESDNERMAERISHARNLLIARERAIVGQPVLPAERVALSRAFHALGALQFSLESQPQASKTET